MFVEIFTLKNVQSRTPRDDEEVAWHVSMLYFREFTFHKENPSEFLTVPNIIAAVGFGTSILHRFTLLDSMRDAIRLLAL